MRPQPINTDHILSALYARLNGDSTFRSLVRSIDKGPKRRVPHGQERPANPSATVHVLTAPLDPELSTVHSTALVNVYRDDLADGRMDSLGLGQAGDRVTYLLHKSHLPTHPEGPLDHPALRFLAVYVEEAIPLRSDHDNEHVVSVRTSLIVQRKGE